MSNTKNGNDKVENLGNKIMDVEIIDTDNSDIKDIVITDEELQKSSKSFEKNNKKAEKLLQNEDKMERFLQRLEKKLKTIPLVGSSLAYVPMMISLVKMYIKKEYTEIPIGTMISIVAALVYVLSPIDIIPDVLPGGFIDDAFVITACLALIRSDMEDYKLWRTKNGLDIADLPDYDKINKDSDKINKFASIFLKGNSKGNKE